MKSLLYLVHRLPYPPNKGDKITSFNMLKYLSKRFNIYLACFVDDESDWQYVDTVKQYCKESCILKLNPKMAKILSLRGLLSKQALSIPYYKNNAMQQWVDATIKAKSIESVLIFSGVMAQYVTDNLPQNAQTVLDLEDVDSDKWRLYAEEHSFPMNWIYKRESQYLFEFEKAMAKKFDSTVLVSKEEADFFKQLVPEVSDKVVHRVQGVDEQFFDPALTYKNPYQTENKVMVFVGAMDYWPNIDAATWFAGSIFPAIKEQHEEALFYIVGMNPTEAVKSLMQQPGVVVTGSVDDVRPYLKFAYFSVSPLRVARGIQNKVLEAMAMQKQIIATENALIGIDFNDDYKPQQADDEASFINQANEMLSSELAQNTAGRTCVLERYNWNTNLELIYKLLQ